MQRLERSQALLLAYSLFVALASLLILSGMISSPSESASAILFGLSAPRLALALGLFLALVFYAGMAFKAATNRIWAERLLEKWFEGKGVSQWIGWLSGISFGLGWIGCFLPAYRAGILENYWARLQPAMVFILIASLATLILFFVARNKLTIRDLNPAPLKLGLPLFIFCLLAGGWMFYSGFGVVSLGAYWEDFWYGVGVPILTSQLIAAIAAGVLFLLFVEPRRQSKRADVLICLLIYAATAYLWAREPLRRSFFFTLSPAPDYVFYPFSDAAAFDAASQFPLIGQNFFVSNNVFFERPLYLSLLAYLHFLFGQDYEVLMAVQAGIFAVLPVLIYLIGRSLDIRSVGFASAIVAVLRGINSISASNMIDTASPKMALTDFPTAIGLALVVLFICEWLKEPKRNRHYPIWIGGAIGFTLMLRTNALLLLAFVPFYVFFRFLHERKQWLAGSCLIVLGVVAVTLPWEIRNLSLGGQMYGPIASKFQNVIEQRYLPTPRPEGSLPPEQGLASITLKHTQPIYALYQDPHAIQGDQPCDKVACFSARHFLHNVITSILVLPTSPALDDASHLIRDRRPYYWDAWWDGTFTDAAPLFLILNLFFIATGIAFAWREKRLPGLTPLAIFVAYNISNGLARTSGGRYIVPADWIVPLYYLLGVFYVASWLANAARSQWNIFSKTSAADAPKQDATSRSLKTAFVFAILLGFGGLIPLSENLRPPRYQNMDPLETLAANGALIEDAGLSPDDLGAFLQSPNANIFIGRVLYPRYYDMNQGETAFSFYPYTAMGFPRMAFITIGPAGERSVVLPGDVLQYPSHTSDVLVLGCKGTKYVDALVVIVLDEHGTVYTRKPASALQCPLQQPVCNNNSVCQ